MIVTNCAIHVPKPAYAGFGQYFTPANDPSDIWANVASSASASNDPWQFGYVSPWFSTFAGPAPGQVSLTNPGRSSTTAAGSAAHTQVLDLQENDGTTTPISAADINQGQMGNCFLLSSIGELALFHPGWISQMIQSNADGTETLYRAANGNLPTPPRRV